jgi:predicted aspartyl protease
MRQAALMRKRLLPRCLLLGVVLGAGAASAAETCVLHQLIKLNMTTIPDGRVSVPMTVGGQGLNMLVDTGGLFSMLTPATVKTLDLRPEFLPAAHITQYGGLAVDHYVVAHDISLGGIVAGKFDFLVMPEHGYPPSINGLIAPDIMRSYDTDFDFANAAFRLFSSDHCEGNVVYWTHDPFGAVEFRLNQFGQITVPIMLDGHEIRATIDTGAYHSVASFETVKDALGIDDTNPALHLVPGATPDHPRYRYPLKTLSLQSITVKNPDVILIPDNQSRQPTGAPKMLLGINVLKQLHLYFAYREHTLYVTPAAAH